MKREGLALLCAAPCRPLFPLALFCGLAVVGRVVLDPGYAADGLAATGGLSWHGQEMLFGFVAGGFVGYLLTALPSWAPDQRLPPRSTLMLVLAWLLARLAAWGGLEPDPLLRCAAALGFPLLTTLLLLRAAWYARSARGTLALGFALLLLAAQAAALVQQLTADLLPLGLALLLSVMAGRMLAAFTWSRLPGRPPQAARFHLGNRLALLSQVSLGGALALTLVAPGREVAQGLLLALAAVAEAARWILWQARPIWRDPGLTQLHLAYVWLPLALGLLAQQRLGLALPGLDGLDGRHALTVGAVSCMIHAVMARSVARRGAVLRPQPDLRLGFALVWMAALVRIGLFADPGHMTAALLWAAGWGLLLRRLIQHLHRPLPHPVFSPRRPPDAPEPRRLFPNPRSLAIPGADPAPPPAPQLTNRAAMSDDPRPAKDSQIPTNLRLLRILEEVAIQGVAVKPADLIDSMGLPKPTIHRLLQTAEAEGFLQRDIDGRSYGPGDRLRALAVATMSTQSLRTPRLAIMKGVAEALGETCNLATPDREGMTYLDRVETKWPLRIQLPRGTQVPFHCTASGKMYLSSLRSDALTAVLTSRPLDQLTEATRTDPEALRRELAETRKRGYACDDEEFMTGMVAVAVPVLDPRKRLLATLSVHAPVMRCSMERLISFLPVLQEAATGLESIAAS